MISLMPIWGSKGGDGYGEQYWRTIESTPLECGPGSDPGVDAICGLSLLLLVFLAPRGFSPGDPVFPSPQIQHFQIPVDLERTVGKGIGDA